MNMSQNSMVMGGVQNNTPMDMFQGLGGGMDTSINGMDQSQSDNMNSNQDLVAAQKKRSFVNSSSAFCCSGTPRSVRKVPVARQSFAPR